MAKLVGDDIVDAILGRGDQIRIEDNPPVLGAAAPAFSHAH